MSGHNPCRCGTRINWRVIHRQHNHSYFESPKGAEHYSDYSSVTCISKGCTGYFRTKANYVSDLPDYNECEEPQKIKEMMKNGR